MSEIKTVTPEQVSIGDTKTGPRKDGKGEYTLYPIGIKVKGQWYNASFWSKEEADQIKQDEPIDLEFFQDTYTDREGKGVTAWKFKLPRDWKLNELIKRVELIESRLDMDKSDPVKVTPIQGGDVDINVIPEDDLPF